jgi:hypothetical protein
MSPERLSRSNDERLYQPRIHSRWIRELYRIRSETGEPMTVLVDRALAEFVERHSVSAEITRGVGGDAVLISSVRRPGER